MPRKINCAALVLLLAAPAQSQSQADLASNRLLEERPHNFQAALEKRRPEPVTCAEKNLILAALPRDGRVSTLKTAARQKLTSLQQILRLHNRESVYEPIVIDVPQAFIGLHARAVVLISEPALKLLNKEELQSLVAHEIGHEYIWEEYESAKVRNDYRRLRELETWCDAVAVLTLSQAGIDPTHLTTGLRKITVFNLRRLGRAMNEDAYPPFADREAFVRMLVVWAAPPSPRQYALTVAAR